MTAYSEPVRFSWPRVPLSAVVSFRNGRRNTNTAVPGGQYPFFVCSSEVLGCNEYDFEDDAVIMAGNNADGVFHLHHFTGKFAARQRTYVITPRSRELDCRWLYYQLGVLQPSFQAAAIGTTTQYVTIDMLRRAQIPMPKRAVQHAITEALGDVDQLLSALTRLIAKKRDLKQAAMQQLLTGKTRLPGFHGDWTMRRVLDLGDVVTGGTPRTDVAEYWGGTYPWVTPTDISERRDMFDSERWLTQKGLDAIRPLPPNSVLVTCIASIGKNAILKVAGACNQQINAVIPNRTNDSVFLYYVFEASKQYLQANAGTTATSILSKKAFSELLFRLPELEEQTAIAAVLSDMDAELEALEARRAKTRYLKQAMTQELLTGKTRLVQPEVVQPEAMYA